MLKRLDKEVDKDIKFYFKEFNINKNIMKKGNFKNEVWWFKKQDVELIKSAMLENSITLTASALECEKVMPTEVYERDMNNANRLIYLVNVLNGAMDYDK